MRHSWNDIKAKALAFSRHWADACHEDSQAKPFWIDFLDIFGVPNKRVATFELNVAKHGGGHGFADLFWPGVLLVEHKSRGKDLDAAFAQAQTYLAGLPDRIREGEISAAVLLVSAKLAVALILAAAVTV